LDKNEFSCGAMEVVLRDEHEKIGLPLLQRLDDACRVAIEMDAYQWGELMPLIDIEPFVKEFQRVMPFNFAVRRSELVTGTILGRAANTSLVKNKERLAFFMYLVSCRRGSKKRLVNFAKIGTFARIGDGQSITAAEMFYRVVLAMKGVREEIFRTATERAKQQAALIQSAFWVSVGWDNFQRFQQLKIMRGRKSSTSLKGTSSMFHRIRQPNYREGTIIFNLKTGDFFVVIKANNYKNDSFHLKMEACKFALPKALDVMHEILLLTALPNVDDIHLYLQTGTKCSIMFPEAGLKIIYAPGLDNFGNFDCIIQTNRNSHGCTMLLIQIEYHVQ